MADGVLLGEDVIPELHVLVLAVAPQRLEEILDAPQRLGEVLVVAPQHPITYKWVYKIKTRSDGSLEHYKAHLMARGFQQEQGHDYAENFAHVTYMTNVRTLFIAPFVHHWSVAQLDIQNAFLNGELCEEVYVQPPPGYSIPDGIVCHLRRSLYGLK
jgi:hypothetical protein